MTRYPKRDCFGYKMGKCSVLTELVCTQRECSFYKTRKQFHSDNIKYKKIADDKKYGEAT